jgi:hypothetical protein
MAEHSMAYVAFDTSKLHNAVAIAEAGRASEAFYLGEFDNTLAATAKLVRKLAAQHGVLSCCYEAGPTGYGLYRQIKQLGHDCIVVAPSLIRNVSTTLIHPGSAFRLVRGQSHLRFWVGQVRVPDKHGASCGWWPIESCSGGVGSVHSVT